MPVLLDTNIIIELWKSNPAIIAELKILATEGFQISEITQAELLIGALNKQDLRTTQRNLLHLTVLPLEESIGRTMSHIIAAYGLSNHLGLLDALIAATALHHGFPLYTLNRKDFRYIAGLRLHEPA